MKYDVILADPPWDIKAGAPLEGYKLVEGKQIWNRTSNKSRDLAYQTMTVEEISSLPVDDISADNCHLFVWVTNSHLPHIFGIIERWGFKYSTTVVWCKNGGGLGGTFKISTEFLIYCRKGSPKALVTTRGTWFNVKRKYENGFPKHSNKPEFFHELIEKTCSGNKLEMFAREQRSGWDVFGNEVENSIDLFAIPE